ncbi:hypothetical protein C3F00_034050 [Pseudomonas sp. MWU13-2860]|nr:hypothetical protein C3F00_034050 [Pseudomonas sp. MWU13-2860]
MTSNRPIDASRRDFLNSAVGVGFALAVQPIAASAIITDGAGLSAGAVEIPTGPAIMPGYAAKPAAASGPLPVVLVVQEIFGVHEHIRDLCRRLAKAGYLAVAPELYFRQGDPSKVASISELVSGLVSKVPDSQVLADLDATLERVKTAGGIVVQPKTALPETWGQIALFSDLDGNLIGLHSAA